MKKLYTESKKKALSRKQQKKDLARIRRRNEVVSELNAVRRSYRQASPELRATRRPYREQKVITAPENFSFIYNTEELIKFFNRMEKLHSRSYDVFIDFSRVKQLTPDSLAVLVSKMSDGKFNYGRNCGGNEPQNKELQQKFVQSGFYDVVIPRSKSNEPVTGSFRKKQSKKVEPEMADDLITFITKNLYGKYRKCGGVTNALLESMGNTRGHAASARGRYETWWAAAQCDIKEKKAYYSFVDNGVGIFRSKQPNVLQQALNKLKITSNTELLQKMLHRQIPSTTGIPYRGRGIPSIFNSLKRGDISNLIIITNDVYARVENNDYRRLSPQFDGTFLYWEYPGENDGKVVAKRAE